MSRWSRTRTLAVGLASTALLALGGAPAAQAAPTAPVTGPPVSTFPAAFGYALGHPAAVAPGTNDYSCRPSAAHPRPVVLVHGTYLNSYDDFAELAPALEAQGYCVFAPGYGGLPGSPLQATGDIAVSAGQVSGVIDDVLAATGATQVDVVGHSQGGMLPRYITKNLPDPGRIASVTALAPSSYGTTFFGILPALHRLVGDQAVGTVLGRAIPQQRQGSDFLAALNAGDPTPGDTTYTVIATRYDEVVTPYTNAFLPGGATNILLQDTCPQDHTDHLGITYDPVTIATVLRTLDPTAPAPVCVAVPPVVS
ncbi:alpha/beta fold hydrolase [Rhodococcus aerolatus]